MNNKAVQGFMKYAGKIATNRFLLSLRDAFLYASGATIVAGFVIMINSVFLDPSEMSLIWSDSGLHLGSLIFGSYQEFLSSGLYDTLLSLQSFFNMILLGTINIFSILVLVALSRELQRNFFEDNAEEHEVGVILYALGAFFLSLPWVVSNGDVILEGIADSSYFGTTGVFTAMLVATGAVFTYNFVLNRGWSIKLPAGVPSAVERSFSAMIPGIAALGLFMILKLVMYLLTPFFANTVDFQGVMTLPTFIISVIQLPLMGISQSPLFSLIIVSGQNILQFFGIHGSSVFGPIINSTWTVLGLENISGQATHIITDLFFSYSVVSIAFALTPLLAVSIFSKQVHLKKLMKLATIPAIFNISEPITYGLPIVLNPYFFIPYMICPPLFFFGTAFLMQIGLLPVVVNSVPWTIPIFIGGILSTNSIIGGLWQLVLLVIGVLIWAPFVKMNDANIERMKLEQKANE